MKLRAGKYYIGDPCYIFTDNTWAKILKETNYFKEGLCKFNDEWLYAHHTEAGDGTYYDNNTDDDFFYSVDSGILAAVPLTLKEKEPGGILLEGCGYSIVTFEDNFEIGYEDGLFTFGHISIQT